MATRPGFCRWPALLLVGIGGCVLDRAGAAPGEAEGGHSGGASCGNGVIEGSESCDDGNTAPGDGCSGDCAVEADYSCSGTPSECYPQQGCTDGEQNGDETDVDCGGTCPEACGDGEACLVHDDCQSQVCEADTCAVPTCVDGAKNGAETDVDCGGTCPEACGDGEGCLVPEDCQSLVCDGTACAAPSCSDGIHNGAELDVDCGGACPACTRIFSTDAATLAILELNGDALDTSGNGRHGSVISGGFAATAWGQGLVLQGDDPQGLDWSAYASLLTHPYTIEIVLVPADTGCWRRIFSFAGNNDSGWYYCNGFQAWPNAVIGQFPAQTRHYLAMVSIAANEIAVYFNGALVGPTNAAFTAPPGEAIFFRDDNHNGSEYLAGVVDALRLSGTARSEAEITAVQQRLDLQPYLP